MDTTDLEAEAADHETSPERLVELASSGPMGVRHIAKANPNLPEEMLVQALVEGDRGAWMNPALPFVLLAQGTTVNLYRGACRAVAHEAKTLLPWEAEETPLVLEAARPVVEQGWQTFALLELLFLPSVTASMRERTWRGPGVDPMRIALVEMGLEVVDALLERSPPGLLDPQEPLLEAVREWHRAPDGLVEARVRTLRRESHETDREETDDSYESNVRITWHRSLEALGDLTAGRNWASEVATFGSLPIYAWRDLRRLETGAAMTNEQAGRELTDRVRARWPDPIWPSVP